MPHNFQVSGVARMYFLGVSKPHTASIPREREREKGRTDGLKEGRMDGRKEGRQTDRQKERKKEKDTYLPVPKSCFRQVTSMSIHCKSFRQGFCQAFCGFSFKP